MEKMYIPGTLESCVDFLVLNGIDLNKTRTGLKYGRFYVIELLMKHGNFGILYSVLMYLEDQNDYGRTEK